MYARAVRSLRLRELQNTECMTAVRAGLGAIIPLQLLTMLSPLQLELRTCGLPYINLEFLKVKHRFVGTTALLSTWKQICILVIQMHIFQTFSESKPWRWVLIKFELSVSSCLHF